MDHYEFNYSLCRSGGCPRGASYDSLETLSRSSLPERLSDIEVLDALSLPPYGKVLAVLAP